MRDEAHFRYGTRPGEVGDEPFLVEMARAACSLAGRPLPDADDPAVTALLPGSPAAAVLAVAAGGRRLGAAWWAIHDPPLVVGDRGRPLPELAMAVVDEARGNGVGGALIEALAESLTGRFAALTLNVHLLNPAVRLYLRAGFTVAGAGRGPFGVSMRRALGASAGSSGG